MYSYVLYYNIEKSAFMRFTHISCPIMEWLLTPFRNCGNLNQRQRHFNHVHSKCMQVIERAFGMLKSWFRRLLRFDPCNMHFLVNDVLAACVLHNLYVLERVLLKFLGSMKMIFAKMIYSLEMDSKYVAFSWDNKWWTNCELLCRIIQKRTISKDSRPLKFCLYIHRSTNPQKSKE